MRARLLIVEDHVLLAEALAARLADDYHVATLTTSPCEEIVTAAVEWNCDIVLLDLVFDDHHVVTTPVIEPIREHGIDVVVLTGVADPRLLRDSIDAGATAVVRKSSGLDRVFEVLDLVVAGDVDALSRVREELRAELSAELAENNVSLAPFERLTPREQDVLAALVAGMSPDDIASSSSVSIATVRSHIHSILEKLSVHSQVAAVSLALRSGWTSRRSM